MFIRDGVRFSAALFFVLVPTLGCDSGNPFDFVPVHGKLTYDDGSLIEADSILLTFNPVASERQGKLAPPGGQTNVNVKDGTFSTVSSRRKGDGLFVGRHKVVVVSFKNGPEGMPVPTKAVPPIYNKESSTPLEVLVDSNNQFLELKVSKK